MEKTLVLSSETTMRCRLMVFLLILVPCLLAGPLSPSAQPPAKMARIGYLSPTSGLQPAGAAFQQGLRDLGWMEGQNITVEYRWAAGQVEQLAALAVELAQLPVEVIVTVGAATAAAQRATPTIPIVFVGVGDPVASGLVRSLAQPGGNITRDSQLERCPHGETAGTPQRDSARALPRGRFVV